MANNQIKKQRIVIKIGSSSLTNNSGGISKEKITTYVNAINELFKSGHEVIIVSSGAVAAGYSLLGYSTRPKNIEGKQAAAAVGQGLLIQAYNEEFRKHNLTTAQILITRKDFSNREQYNNAYNTLNVLLKQGIIPIINENDTVSVEELTFGDNDMLSALVAGLIHADTLVILTDTDGLHDKDPRFHQHAKKFRHIEDITADIEAMASENNSSLGTGGMRSKISAAKLALSLGVHVYIGTYNNNGSLIDIVSGKGSGTYFGQYKLNTIKTKKQWIAFHSEIAGTITIDNGAASALLNYGKSHLPAGVKNVIGNFSAGQVVEIVSIDGDRLGKGLVNYSSSQLRKVQGYSSYYARELADIEREEVIHRNDLVVLK